MQIWAKVQVRFEGFHCWPEAPDEVDFLRSRHRHEFHVTLLAQQFHDDRDLEYVLLKRWLETFLLTTRWAEDASCEMIARCVIDAAQLEYGVHRKYRCEVLEDGENGALLES